MSRRRQAKTWEEVCAAAELREAGLVPRRRARSVFKTPEPEEPSPPSPDQDAPQ